MTESKRQKQVAGVVQRHLSDIFLKEAREITGRAMVTISRIRMTPDLQEARVYLSIFNVDKPDEIMTYIQANDKALRRLLGQRVRHQLRKVPELRFFRDDTLDEVFKLEQIFEDLKKERKEKDDTSSDDARGNDGEDKD